MEGDPDKYIFLGGALIVIGVIGIFSSLTKSSNAVLMSGIISMIVAVYTLIDLRLYLKDEYDSMSKVMENDAGVYISIIGAIVLIVSGIIMNKENK